MGPPGLRARTSRTGKLRLVDADSTARSTARRRTPAGRSSSATTAARVTALDARTGAVRWQARSFSRLRHRPRVLLRHADRRLRARLRRRTRTARSTPSAPTTGNLLWARHVGHVRLHGAGGLGPEGLRRHLRRQVLRPRRRHGRHALGARDAGGGPRRADRDGRARLLRRPAASAASKGVRSAKKRAERHLRPRRAHGEARLAFPDGQYSPIVADAERVYLAGATAGLRARRSAPRAERAGTATAIPVSGQTRYDVWKTRAMKRSDEDRDREAGGRLPVAARAPHGPDEPRGHRQPDDERRAARTGRRRSGRRSRPRSGAAPRARSRGCGRCRPRSRSCRARARPASAIRNGRKPADEHGGERRRRSGRASRAGSPRASSMTTKNGSATSGELLQQDRRRERDRRPDVAGARQQREGEEQRQDRRSRRRSRTRRPATSSGLAATAAPIARRQGSGASKRSTAKKQPIVASRTSTR